ncbi:SOS response-associated peptidase family protein [Deinococcus daejeonensis]|uniref:Abasic site processing protein n=1 Tax=Deinococcus daejeonensis TaxID=1007098 RepID=A0ABQ2JG52_9DEIO|nr:SOS response-associated peptidase family protein [Deinococcus daejeonensis]GGN44608.1 hypothetical protein GCM10010842_33330 [Deinococcus daejeonensis]
MRPGDTLRFLRRERQGQGALGWALAAGHWGLVTTGTAAAEARRHVFQARVESLSAHRTYRDLLVISHCVIPLAAYWDAPTASPLPLRVLVRPHLDVPTFAAGLHASILTPAGPLISCAVFTRPAPPDLAGTVARMPAVLREDEVMPWLGGSSRDARRTARDSRAWEALTVAGSRLVLSGTAGFAAP